MIALGLPVVERLVLIGAHCDDIAIGAGATARSLALARPGLRVEALVLTGGGTDREAEERAALAALLPGADWELTVLDLPDGRLPDHRGVVKDALQSFARSAAGSAAQPPVDLVLAPHSGDAHQDHRLLGEMVPTAFRDALHLGYEILKWESDLPRTTVYLPVDDDGASAKVRILTECYPSQHGHDWFDEEAFRGLMRVRGAQCHTRYAEAFCADKQVLALSPDR